MAVALHCVDEYREEHPKALAADAISRLPQHRQRLMDRGVIESCPRAPASRCRRLIEHAQCVLAMIPGYSCELGQNLPSLPPIGGRLIPDSNRILQLSARCHTQLPRHLHRPAAPLPGSRLREATTADSVTKIVSQCAGRSNCRGSVRRLLGERVLERVLDIAIYGLLV